MGSHCNEVMTMNLNKLLHSRLLPIVLVSFLSVSTAAAQRPSQGGNGDDGKREENQQGDDKRGKKDKKDKGDKHDRQDLKIGGFFRDQQRTVVRDYYGTQYRSGHCPPGLAKKNNGCMPPGQAKKWAVGQPLSRDVTVYSVPLTLSRSLGTPPSGYKYVRVASDILLLTLGSNVIVDALQAYGMP